MKESLSAEHGGELFRNAFEELLDGCGVADECGRHFESSWGNVANSCLDIVGDPLDEVGRVFVLNVQHLFVHFFH